MIYPTQKQAKDYIDFRVAMEYAYHTCKTRDECIIVHDWAKALIAHKIPIPFLLEARIVSNHYITTNIYRIRMNQERGK